MNDHLHAVAVTTRRDMARETESATRAAAPVGGGESCEEIIPPFSNDEHKDIPLATNTVASEKVPRENSGPSSRHEKKDRLHVDDPTSSVQNDKENTIIREAVEPSGRDGNSSEESVPTSHVFASAIIPSENNKDPSSGDEKKETALLQEPTASISIRKPSNDRVYNEGGEKGNCSRSQPGINLDTVKPGDESAVSIPEDGDFGMQSSLQETDEVARSVRLDVPGLSAEPRKFNQGPFARRMSHRNRLSSMELRKLPVDILLKPISDECISGISDEFAVEEHSKRRERKDLLHMFCLRPGYSLRTQLMLSFGTLSAFTTIVVVVTCILISLWAAEDVRIVYRSSFEDLGSAVQGRTARYLAERLGDELLPLDVVEIVYEATHDRFAGYPNASDDEIPFKDMYTGERVYPIVGRPIPFEWEFESNVNSDNYDEHFQGRDYFRNLTANSVNAGFFVQGACDPSVNDPAADTYWPNCTDANNDLRTGGITAPSPTTELIHRKSSDLVPIMRSLFESKEQIRDIGLQFSNSGVGATVSYPQYPVRTSETYESNGCDWLLERNPYDTSRTIGTQDMVERCHKKGEEVSFRSYNPLETEWCANQALSPERFSAAVWVDPWDNSEFLLSVGRAIYDRTTQEFVACIYVSLSIDVVSEELEGSKVTEGSEISVVVFNEQGIVLTSSSPEVPSYSTPVYDTPLGLTQQTYEELYNLVDYDSESGWSPDQAQDAYQSFSSGDEFTIVSAYPLPPIPNRYDPSYRPAALILVSTPVEDVVGVISEVDEVVDSKVDDVTKWSIVAGAIGLVAALLIIFAMANMLTSPLRSMSRVANDIVSNFGDSSKDQRIQGTASTREALCTPHTELSEVVAEFNKMVSTFSGSMLVKSAVGKRQEIENCERIRGDLFKLYESRREKGFGYRVDSQPTTLESESFAHTGSNVIVDRDHCDQHRPKTRDSAQPKKGSLFLWTVGLIVTPLLVVNVTITAWVMSTISVEFTDIVDEARNFYLDVQTQARVVHARLRANTVSSITARSADDLFVMTRYLSWLLFGGLERADTFSEMTTGVDQCKTYDDFEDCPYVEANYVCDCAWNDPRAQVCTEYETDSRKLQIPFFTVENDMTQPDGDRNSTAFPKSPRETSWWDDPTRVPGWEKGTSTSGHDSTYDRLVASSALPLQQVLYNYDKGKESLLGTYLTFEGDGMTVGYNGCTSMGHVQSSIFQSTEENRAAELRPELCPVGKFGYDPRCREWYDTGKRLALQNDTFLHVTAPYEFAALFASAGATFAQSATLPLIDPRTGEHVGQTLLDFSADPLFLSLEKQTSLSDGGFPFLIVPYDDPEGDTVIGPGYSMQTSKPKQISELVMEEDMRCHSTDSACQERLESFGKIVDRMKEGKAGNATFARMVGNGEETVHIAFAPVRVKSPRPVNSADFSRGVFSSEYLIYSVALAEIEEGILGPFERIEDATEKQIKSAIGILSAVLVAAAAVVIYISHHVALSITEPMVYLLELIRSINRDDPEQQLPDVRGLNSSREIAVFADAMETLYKVLRSANSAFYCGELEMAYLVLVDALRLFRRLDNKKAIGIASNNIGNTLLGMYRECKINGWRSFGGLSRKQLVQKGINHFHSAIELGEKAYDQFYSEQGWTPICLDFMQHLANRYFNRGLFLLSVKDDHPKPDELEDLGMRDLQIARDMDLEVIAYGEDIGWGSADRIDSLFQVNLVRLRGYNILLDFGYPEEWDTKELIDETFGIIHTEVKKESSPLFKHLGLAGCMQELETELMKFLVREGDIKTAAQVAVRMIQEDEQVFVEALSKAIDVLLLYIDAGNFDDNTSGRLKITLLDYKDMIGDAVEVEGDSSYLKLGTSIITKSTASSFSSNKKQRLYRDWSLSQSSGRFVTMENL